MTRAFLPSLPFLLFITSIHAQDSTTSSASPSSTNPTVTLDQATVTGTSTPGVQKFLGIPYASPPVNNLRFAPPQPVTSYNGSINATQYGYSCPQQNASLISPYFQFGRRGTEMSMKLDSHWADVDFADEEAPPENEDCLTLNIMRPDNATQSSNLPVVIWIVGGGFETGTTYYSNEDDTKLVQRSTQFGQPMIFVSMNYRVSGWGFLASQETKNANATNVGIRDQRAAIQWVNRYIGNFGGDSSRVTLWGQSAGAMSASIHMLLNNGNPDGLFRGAFMQSGAPIPVGNYTGGQVWYDQLVNQTNCTGSSDTTLNCLRNVPYEEMKTVINRTPNYHSYQSLNLAWVPRADGDFLVDNPQRLVEKGSVANIPFVSGNVADEGTVFALSSLNVTTDDEFRQWLKFTYMANVPDQNVSDVMALYPSNPSEGSPFNTSFFNVITPQYKRSAALQGDVVFQAPRRFFVQQRSGNQPVWAYQDSRGMYTPFVGAYHSSDISKMVLNDYLIRFVNNLDPNNGTGPDWPRYSNSSKQIYWFTAGNDDGVEISTDDYRVPQMEYLTNLSLAYPL